jgi:hypothetical protein
VALPSVWGATAAEVRRPYPADTALVAPGAGCRDVVTMTRAIGVDAPVEVTWRWLCQVGVAPYSYDWLDNRGRRSPRTLTPGADRLELGQPIAKVFELVSFEAPHQWTGVATPAAERLFGRVATTYAAEPAGAGSRIVCRIAVCRRGRIDRVRVALLSWGDLVMMRKQLRTLRGLAERG